MTSMPTSTWLTLRRIQGSFKSSSRLISTWNNSVPRSVFRNLNIKTGKRRCLAKRQQG
jgi:hypothetical protein